MKKILIILIVFISTATSIVGVKNPDCDVDEKFKEWFFIYLERCENFTKYFEGDDTEKVIESVYFLNAVTGIQSNIYLGDAVLYDKKEFKKDKKKWLDWYENNKCEITMFKADSIYEAFYKEKPKLEWQSN